METNFKPAVFEIPNIADCLSALKGMALLQKAKKEKVSDVIMATMENVVYISATTSQGEEFMRLVVNIEAMVANELPNKHIHDFLGAVRIKVVL